MVRGCTEETGSVRFGLRDGGGSAPYEEKYGPSKKGGVETRTTWVEGNTKRGG